MNGLTYVQPTHANVAVATTATAVLVANPYRSYALLTNISDTDIWLAIDGNDAVVGQGIFLSAYGGSFEMTPGEGNLTSRSISAIQAGTGTKTLVTTEAV